MNPWNALVGALGQILSFFFDLVPNYGVAIVLLTLLLSILMFPLTLKQTRSMTRMQEIQPDVKRLQKEHKGNREELNKELMALYQERGVNPASGCLPMIVQMPIWFGLFSVLRVNVNPAAGELISNHIPAGSDLYAALEAGNTTFLTMDMLKSPSDALGLGFLGALPYLLLILLVIGTSFYQSIQTQRKRKDSGQEVNAQQQGMQTAMKIMPLFFGFISFTLPAGLVLYFAVSNLFRVGQQAYILNLEDRENGDEKSTGPAGDNNGNDAVVEETQPSKPSPNASKKRNKRRRK